MDTLPRCKSCDVEIRWARVDGRWRPFEAEPDRAGTHVLIEDEITREHHALIAERPGHRKLLGPRHVMHFEVCPARGQRP